MQYLKKKFTVAVGSPAYRDGWDAIFMPAELADAIESAKTKPLVDLGTFPCDEPEEEAK